MRKLRLVKRSAITIYWFSRLWRRHINATQTDIQDSHKKRIKKRNRLNRKQRAQRKKKKVSSIHSCGQANRRYRRAPGLEQDMCRASCFVFCVVGSNEPKSSDLWSMPQGLIAKAKHFTFTLTTQSAISSRSFHYTVYIRG
ncbi:hypothetical protein AVEN_40733-1 [Araneus ventricosus]|uniref:Uncharacterized protein n=1 Tax=Araneus ventricosus TaxID=182803 RepID=A0A4Y2EII5_ARAVE|nr:hypothetical protein AVEN_40733-1 [Araneus ventricosus]